MACQRLWKVGIFFCEGGDDLIDLVFDVVRIHHGKFRVVVVVPVVRYGGVFVHQRIGAGVPLVVDGGVTRYLRVLRASLRIRG